VAPLFTAAAPVKVYMAGNKRVSSHSTWSRQAAFTQVCPRESLELPLALFATICHQVKAMLQLLSKEAASNKHTDMYACFPHSSAHITRPEPGSQLFRQRNGRAKAIEQKNTPR
jgi:hypothetical protein